MEAVSFLQRCTRSIKPNMGTYDSAARTCNGPTLLYGNIGNVPTREVRAQQILLVPGGQLTVASSTALSSAISSTVASSTTSTSTTTISTSSPPLPDDSKGSTFPPGAIAGIVIGIILLMVVLVTVLWYRRRGQKKVTKYPSPTNDHDYVVNLPEVVTSEHQVGYDASRRRQDIHELVTSEKTAQSSELDASGAVATRSAVELELANERNLHVERIDPMVRPLHEADGSNIHEMRSVDTPQVRRANPHSGRTPIQGMPKGGIDPALTALEAADSRDTKHQSEPESSTIALEERMARSKRLQQLEEEQARTQAEIARLRGNE